MMSDGDFVQIVGGGVIGLLIARELLHAGRRVALYERQALGRESSWAGGGILSPLYPWRYAPEVNRLARWSQQAYPEMCADLHAGTGIDPEWTRSGLLILDADQTEVGRDWARTESVAMDYLDQSRLATAEPALAGDHAGGLLMPAIAQVRNPRLLTALRIDLLRKGLELHENVAVQSFTAQAGRLHAFQTSAGEVPSTRCVVAGGAWTGELLAGSGAELSIEPVRGQMLLFKARPGVLHHIVLKDHHYAIPRRDGRVLVGSTLEHVGFDKGTTEAARAELLGAVDTLIPALGEFPLERQWAGLRPGSPNGVPYIGEHPTIQGLFVCAGHYRNGFALGPASARLAADLMLGRAPILDPVPYALFRH